MHCIARAFEGAPLSRSVASVGNGFAYIAKPSALAEAACPDEIGVAFPLSDLFVYDDSLMDELESAFESGQIKRLDGLWASARPLPL